MDEMSYSIYTSTGYWISRLAKAMEREFESHLQAYDVTRAGWAVLSAIFHDSKTTPAELASFVGVDGAAITRHLDRLEKRGLVVREPSTKDRRSVRIKLTRKAKRLIPKIVAASTETNEKFTRALTRSEIDAVQETIGKMLSRGDTLLGDI
jgi:DNA-binding MarR family transcriptional regulator